MAFKVISRAEAKQEHLVRYFTGLPCKHGHVSERLTVNGVCLECTAKRVKEEYWSNREENLARQKARRESDLELNAKKKARRLANDPCLAERIKERERVAGIRQAAINSQEMFYVDGVPCPSGHVGERFTRDGKCRECNRIQSMKRHEQSVESDPKKKQARVDRQKQLAENKKKAEEQKIKGAKWREAGEARRTAIANGETRYVSERPCHKGHVGERFTANGCCVQCHEQRDKSGKSDYDRKRFSENFDEISAQKKARYALNREELIQKSVEWAKNNPDKRRVVSKRHKEKKRKEDPIYVVVERMRSRIRIALLNGGFKKQNTTESIIGCTTDELRKHIERQFTNGMSWDRISEIHIDHIVPLDSASTEEEVIALCHFTNLRPVWAKDNLSKGAKRHFLI